MKPHGSHHKPCSGRAEGSRADGRLPPDGGWPLVPTGDVGWCGPEGRSTSPAWIIDWDGTTLTVMVDAIPPDGTPTCLRLTWPSLTHWIAVRVVTRRRMRIGPYQAGLKPLRAADQALLRAIGKGLARPGSPG